MKYYISIFFVLLFSFPAIAEDADERLKTIEDTLKKQQETIAELKGQKAVGRLRLMDTSIDALFAAGGSTENDTELQNLQGGGHDPRKRGFTVQNVELSFRGAVDTYLTGEAHIIYFLDPLTSETRVELEETFMTTTSLP